MVLQVPEKESEGIDVSLRPFCRVCLGEEKVLRAEENGEREFVIWER
jgi:hypothetical protein